jgi:hypothetical protein
MGQAATAHPLAGVDDLLALLSDLSSVGTSQLMGPGNRVPLRDRRQIPGCRRRAQAAGAFTGPKSTGNQRPSFEKSLT